MILTIRAEICLAVSPNLIWYDVSLGVHHCQGLLRQPFALVRKEDLYKLLKQSKYELLILVQIFTKRNFWIEEVVPLNALTN